MGGTCHLKPLVTTGTRLGVTKMGLKIPDSHSFSLFFFFFCGMWRLNRDTKAAGVGFVGRACSAAEPHPVPPVTVRCCCLKLLNLEYSYDPSRTQEFPLFPRAGLTLIQRPDIPTGRDPARRSFPATDWGEFWRRFSSSILPWRGGPAPVAFGEGMSERALAALCR